MNKRIDIPLCLTVENIKFEGRKTATLTFNLPEKFNLKISPGQYFMLWLPGDDEIPISVSRLVNNYKIEFTICAEGPTSSNFLKLTEDDFIGLRGPYGNGFEISSDIIPIIIGGGMGITPLRFLIYYLASRTQGRIILIQGAKTTDELFFREELNDKGIEIHYCTDDGSFGFHGFPTVILENTIQKIQQDNLSCEIYSCGPEKMLKSILNIVTKYNLETNTQFSIADRFIRCGFGICGSCYLDDLGLSVCRDGPVFRGDILLKVSDFGYYGRSANGSKYSL